jgi:hypothetical protein
LRQARELRLTCALQHAKPLDYTLIEEKPSAPFNTKPYGATHHNRNKPSTMLISENLLFSTYFLLPALTAPLPRMALKNSDELGSSTKTSLFLLKLAL